MRSYGASLSMAGRFGAWFRSRPPGQEGIDVMFRLQDRGL
jgi:hypothetical protein